MSNEVLEAGNGFKIKVPSPGTFYNNEPIVEGREVTEDGYRGTTDVALNNNTLYANVAMVQEILFQEEDKSASMVPLVDPMFRFRWRPTVLEERDEAEVTVRTVQETPSDQSAVTVYSSVGSTASGPISEGEHSLTLSIDPNVVEELGIKIEAPTDNDDAWITGARWKSKALNVAALDGTTWEEEGFRPTATEQWAKNEAYSVPMLEDAQLSTEKIFQALSRTVLLYSANIAALDVSTDYLKWGAITANTSEYKRAFAAMYYPRAGVNNLEIYVNGFTEDLDSTVTDGDLSISTASGPAVVSVRIQRYEGTQSRADIPLDLEDTEVLWGVGNWAAEGTKLPIPYSAEGPLIIEVWTKAWSWEDHPEYATGRTFTKSGRLLALSIIEERPN